MTKLYFCRNNAYDFILSYNPDDIDIYGTEICRMLYTDEIYDVIDYVNYLQNIQDNTSWEILEGTPEEILKECEILAEIETNNL